MSLIESCLTNNFIQEDDKLFNFLKNNKLFDEETEKASSIRWNSIKKLEEDDGFVHHQFNDFCKRYGFKNEDEFVKYLKDIEIIAEIGAGEGRAVDWYLKYSDATIFALEISDSVYYLNEKYKNEPRVIILKADALNHPFKDGTVGLLSMEQSIHHLSSPKNVFNSLSKSLNSNGKVLLSAYAQKSSIREKFDLLIRDQVAKLDSDKKYKFAKQITELSKIMSQMDINIEIPVEFKEFGEMAGNSYGFQRFFYYSIMKCFWNDEYSLEKNIEINFDWYNYPVCSKVSLNSAVNWFIDSNLLIEYIDANESNVNIRGIKS